MQHPQQAQFFPDPSLPPGQGDLEVLERLKDAIKNNQHEFFRAIPRPAALASLYKGPLPFRVLSHPEQVPENPEKAMAMPSTTTVEKLISSNFAGDAHETHAVSAAQSHPSVPSRLGVSRSTISSTPADPRDQNRPSNNGSIALQSHLDDPLHLATSQFRSASTEDATDVNGGDSASNMGTNLPPSRFGADSTFSVRETSRRGSTSDAQQGRPQLLSSPERRRHGPDSEYGTSRHPPYMSDKERPLPRDMLPYDHERDWEKEHEILERDRERERDQRWSDPRRFDRRPPSFDRHSLPDDDRRPPHVEDKRPPSFVDRRSIDDRRIPNYERRALLEENRSRNAPYRDLPQGSYLGDERRLDAAQAAKTHVSTPLTSSSVPSPGPPVAIAPVPTPVDPTTDRMAASDRRSSGSLSAPMTAESQLVSTSCFVAPIEDHSSHVPLHEPTSIAHHQLMLRAESTRLFPEERLSKPPEIPGTDPAALPSTLNDSSHTRVPKPLHIVDSRSVLNLNGDRERFSLTAAADDRTPPLSTYSRAPSVSHDESRPHLPHPTPTPSTVSSAQSSLSLRARESSRERPSSFRPYYRSEFNRPSEDDRRLDGHPLPPGDGIRRYDGGRWSPTHYGDRRGYRESHDRDRLYWASKDRTRDRLPQPHHVPPSHWDRERGRYPEPSYTGLHKRFVDRDQGNRERWSVDDPLRRPFETFAPRGRPRSPGSPNREFTELRPPPPKRARDDNYAGATGEAYYPRPHHPSSPSSSPNKDSLPPPLPPVPIPVPIPILHPASPLRYNHHRPPPVEPYGESYGGYERDGPRGPTGPGYSREGTR